MTDANRLRDPDYRPPLGEAVPLGIQPAILILLVGFRGRTGTTVDLPPVCPGSSRKEKTACGSG